MGRKRIEALATSGTDADTLYRLLLHAETWPSWSALDSYELIRPGSPDPDGVGTIRLFRTGRSRSREEVVEAVAGKRLSYVLLEGLPLRGYRADIDLTRRGDGGTQIAWHSSFEPKWPGTGWLYRKVLAIFIQRCVDGLASTTPEAAQAMLDDLPTSRVEPA